MLDRSAALALRASSVDWLITGPLADGTLDSDEFLIYFDKILTVTKAV
jgi:hypothetical protein